MNATHLQENTTSHQSLPLSRDELNTWLDQRFEEKLKEQENNKTPSLSIIATKGILDWASPLRYPHEITHKIKKIKDKSANGRKYTQM